MRLDKEQQHRFLDLLEDVNNMHGIFTSVRRYSGRAMYGRECVAILGEYINPFVVALRLAERAERHGFDIIDIPVPDVDSLGRGSVVYWPQVEWPEGRAEQEEEEDEWA